MDKTLIPWDFLLMLLAIAGMALTIVLCQLWMRARKRARLTSPRKDYVRGSEK